MDLAAIGFEVKTDQLDRGTASLTQITQAASAADRAAQRWGMSIDSAGQSSEQFSKRVQRAIDALQFQRQQLTRSAAEQERYAAARRAGVSAESAAGQAVMASVQALQAQRAAAKSAAEVLGPVAVAGKAGSGAIALLTRTFGPLVAAFGAAAIAQKLWAAGMKAGDLGEQAEQIGVTTDQLQAYRFAGVQAGIETEQMDTALTKLAKSMGTAAEGNKEMIELFQRLGVKILDANGQLRPVGDTLPEVAKGILDVGSSSQRTADLMTIFGRSGAKMTTVLKDVAEGNDKIIARARALGGILESDVIEAWDKVSDSMKRAGAASDVTMAKIGAPIITTGLNTVESVLSTINEQFAELAKSIALINTHRGVLEQIMEVVNILTFGIGAKVVGKDAITRAAEGIDRARAVAVEAEVELQRLQALSDRGGMSYRYNSAIEAQRQKVAAANDNVSAAEAVLAGVKAKDAGTMPPTVVTGTKGAGSPVPKGQVEAYQKIIAGAQQYVAMKNIETQALGMNTEAAARLKHEQELLGKATEGNIALGPQQIAELKGLAAAMAEADAKFAGAKFMDDAVTKSKEFIAAQEIEQATLFMSAEAASAYRIEQELLNKAANDNIVLTEAQKQKIGELASQMAAAEARTTVLRDIVGTAREAFTGFFTDLAQGLQQGATFWSAFSNAATNALNRIASKLIEMAAQKLFENAFGGSGGGGGFLNGIFNWLGFGGGSVGSPGLPTTPNMGTVNAAKGRVFEAGNIIPFARGGIVNRPTLFPFANGTGLMGEAGPEGILPLRRGRGGRLGVEASGGGGDVFVTVINNTDSKVSTRKSRGPGGAPKLDVIIETVEAAMAGRMSRGQGGLDKAMQGRFGLQPVGGPRG